MKRNYKTEVVSRLKSLDRRVELIEAGSVNHFPREYNMYYLVAQSPNPASRNVFISAGIHGDEPAGVYASLDFAESHIRKYTDDFSFVIVPCINPGGFEKGTHNNPNGFNLNREFLKKKPQKEISILKRILAEQDRHYCVAIDMHEDDPREKLDGFPISENPNGFYMYEVCPKKASLGEKIIRILKRKGFPINSREKVYWDMNNDGLILEPWGAEKRKEELTTLLAYMRKYAAHAINPETLPTWSLKKRKQAQLIVLETALDSYRKR